MVGRPSFRLLSRTGGRLTAASGAAAPAKPKAARATEVGEGSRGGRMPLGPARRENKKKRWAARTTRPKWFWVVLRKEKKGFQILIQRIIFKFKF
jgi:hypothetical protein